MSLKAVELQVAIPRTQEISRTQDQLNHRMTHGQQVIIDEQKRLSERNRRRPEDVKETAKGKIKEKQEKAKKGTSLHSLDPSRGQHVDISL